MPITLITGPANAGKAQVVLDAVRREIAHGEEPLLIVPTRADAEAYLRELAGQGVAMGIRVQRFDGLIEEAVRRAGVREASFGGLGRERLIASLLRRGGALPFSPGLLTAVGALLGEQREDVRRVETLRVEILAVEKRHLPKSVMAERSRSRGAPWRARCQNPAT